ncbi:MAG: superoxide dismutase [Burkholderiaceae bacterium]|nr:superoxide dismutase [Burkholderiaceae bacterium]
MAFQLPKLPYALNALAPVISEETMQYHYGKHHQTYVNNLNQLVAGKPFEHMMLDEVVMMSAGFDQAVFNNAAQAWNHTFFWMCLSPRGGGQPGGRLYNDIVAKWGSFEAFRDDFVAKAAGNFGSGWTWLVFNPETEGLEIVNTSNAETPLASDNIPLLVVDVWEHAYYIDYRNARVDFVRGVMDRLVDWDFVSRNYYRAC